MNTKKLKGLSTDELTSVANHLYSIRLTMGEQCEQVATCNECPWKTICKSTRKMLKAVRTELVNRRNADNPQGPHDKCDW